jgi:hypothetical protein
MAIIRVHNPKNYTVINNDLINDTTIDWRELGLLTYLLSKPDNWEVSVSHLQKIRKTGRDSIYKSLKKLMSSGYVIGKAKQGGFEYTVFDSPQNFHLTENQLTETHLTEIQLAENQLTEIHLTEKPTQVNTDIQQILKEQQILTKSKGDVPKFQKPSPEEISAFCIEAGISIDVQHFFDYYESNGWRVGRNPMKNWQATVRNWEKNDKTFKKPAQTSFKKPYGEPPKYELSSKFKQDHGVEDFIDSTATTISNKGINYGR